MLRRVGADCSDNLVIGLMLCLVVVVWCLQRRECCIVVRWRLGDGGAGKEGGMAVSLLFVTLP